MAQAGYAGNGNSKENEQINELKSKLGILESELSKNMVKLRDEVETAQDDLSVDLDKKLKAVAKKISTDMNNKTE